MHNISKITAIYLLIVLGIGLATKPRWALVEETEHEIHVVGEYPKVGEVFNVLYRVRLKPEINHEYGQRNFYIKFFTGSSFKAEVLDTSEIVVPSLVPGEWQEFRGQFRIPKPYNMVFVNTSIRYEGVTHNLAGGTLRLYLIDSMIGQYGTKEQYSKRSLPLTWRYDPADGIWLDEGHSGYAEWNMRIIATAKKLEPALSDSEALCLHADIVNENTPYQCSGPISPGKTSVTEEELFDFLLRHGWLWKHRAGEVIKKEWLKQLSEENRQKVEELQEKGIWEK